MRQTNYHFSFTIPIKTNIEQAWNNLTDVSTWQIWDTELISAQLQGEFTLGAVGKMKPKIGPELSFSIIELTANKSYTLKPKMPFGYLIIKRTLKFENELVYFTDDIAFTGFLKRVFGLILGGKFRKLLPEVLINFKKILETK